MKDKKIKICRIATAPIAMYGYKKYFELIGRENIELTLVCSNGYLFENLKSPNNYRLIPIEIKRDISLLWDIKSLITLIIFLRKEKFDIVHSNTPKAGLLVSVAAFIARVPIRLHHFTGQRWVFMKGMKRKILILCDKLTSTLNTHCFADSKSQVDFLINHNIIKRKRISCLGEGSFGGVDLEMFSKEKFQLNVTRTKNTLNLKEGDFVISFLGRVVKDKGIKELVKAFKFLEKKYNFLHLLLIGPFEEEQDPLDYDILSEIKSNPRIHAVGMALTPQKFLAVTDLFCLASYREGFGSVVLEANAMQIPSVGTNIVGLRDSIIDGETGLLCEPYNDNSLSEKIEQLIVNQNLRANMGKRAYARVKKTYSCNIMKDLLLEKYFHLMENHRA